ncbi:MAG: hypothetical protein FJ280_22525 [Planctomycetes bacterium]|nr:hypothetical protein [Planctomycetota bacterium]
MWIMNTPRGLEVLLKKASVDPEFRKLLLERRAEAARTIEIELTDAEREMLANIPAEQLEQIIRNTKVKPEHRAVFLGKVGKLMVAAVVGVGAVSLLVPQLARVRVSAGISPDEIRRMKTIPQDDVNAPTDPNVSDPIVPPEQPPAQPVTRGHAADNPGRARPARPPVPGTSSGDDPGTASTC